LEINQIKVIEEEAVVVEGLEAAKVWVATEEEETAVGAVDFKSLRSQCAQI
jgi:hypothetical protein